MEKIVGLALEFICKKAFLIGQVPIKNTVENFVFAIQHIGNRKKKLRSTSPVTMQMLKAYSCSFTLKLHSLNF